MADDQTPPEGDQLGEGGTKALEAERRARRDAERELKKVQDQLKELGDKDKSEVERLRDEVASLTKERDQHLNQVLRSEVAMAKGLTAAQAKRLVGTTKEELEADADEILDAFPAGNGGATPPPSPRPVPDLKGGTDPTQSPVETDPAKLAESVPRL